MEILLKQPYSFWQTGKRSNQEDARFPNCDTPQGYKPAFVVCDGVGGQDKGEVASRTVAEAIGRYMENVDLTKPFTSSDFSKVLEYVYSCLYKKMRNDTREMATTMAFVCVNSAGVFCAHMGDSRIYQVRPGVGIMYQSEDHSLVNALVHSGNLTPEEAINHPKSNVITRCISYVEKGMDKPSATTIQLKDVEAGDYFFLCSDGVVHCIDDDKLFSILSSEKTDKEKIHLIAERSKASSDNNTAYLIGVEQVSLNNDRDSVKDIDITEEIEISGIVTAPLDKSYEVADEVYANVESTGNKISNFFKGLFK